MKIKNWEEVTAANGSAKLPVGGYVCIITAVEDEAKYERLAITFDIDEGQYKGFYANSDGWRHQFRKFYSDKASPFFKAFLEVLAESNPSFSIAEWQKTCNEKALVGLRFGGLFQILWKTSEKTGKWTEIVECGEQVPVANIQRNDFALPPVQWLYDRARHNNPPDGFEAGGDVKPAAKQEQLYDGDIPF